MLEFIVLGQIPGTGFVLTFSWIVTLAAVLLGSSIVRHEYKLRHNGQQIAIEELAL